MKKIILPLLLALILTGCANSNSDQAQKNIESANTIVNNQEASNTNNNLTNQDKQMTEQNQEATSTNQSEVKEFALIKTNMGDIKIKLNAEKAPISVANFEKYVNNKFYDGTIFHRVMDGFMIQGGGFDTAGNQKETLEPIKNEAKNGLSNKRGTLAMARTLVVDSATSQFFINLIDNNFLDYKDDSNYGYAVFGEVVDGMDVVDKIAKVETGDHGINQNWPVENVIINSIEMVE